MGYGESFALTLFTDDPALAVRADAAGVDRIGPDLERLGKQERQGGLAGSHRISDHDPTCLATLRAALRRAQLFTRANRLHAGSPEEVEAYVEAGVEVIMLPAFQHADDVRRFLEIVAGRALVVPLLEHVAAIDGLDEILGLEGVGELHIGLNDLQISLGGGGRGRFELIVSDYLEQVAHRIRDAGAGLGLAGLGRVGDSSLPIPSDLIYWQLPRLRVSGSLLARSFFPPDYESIDLVAEVAACRRRLSEVAAAGTAAWQAERERLAWHLSNVASP
jgi:hypothetical protein